MLQSGTIIHCQYMIERELGQRNCGALYLAVNTQDGAKYFIQEIEQQDKNCSRSHQELFEELNRLKILHSSYAPGVVEVWETDGSYLICMDYVEGKSLQSLIDAQGPVAQADAVKWCIQLCDVLHRFHAQAHVVLYCDIQPANILLKSDGNIALIGFDTACGSNSRDSMKQGKMVFPTLKQLNGGVSDVRAEMYSMGALLCFLLTGNSPGMPTPKAILLGEMEIAYAGTSIEKIVWKCCQKEPEKRYRNEHALKAVLEKVGSKSDSNAAKQGTHRVSRCLIITVSCLVFFAAVIVLLTISECSVIVKRIELTIICVCIAFVECYAIRQAITHGEKQRMEPKESSRIMATEHVVPGKTTDYLPDENQDNSMGKTVPLQKETSVQFEVTEKVLFVHTDIII